MAYLTPALQLAELLNSSVDNSALRERAATTIRAQDAEITALKAENLDLRRAAAWLQSEQPTRPSELSA